MNDQRSFGDPRRDLAGQRTAVVADFHEIAGLSAWRTAGKSIRLKLHPIGAHLQQCFVSKNAVTTADTHPAAVLSGAAAIGHERVILDTNGVLGLHHFDRHVGQVLRGVGDRLNAVLVGSAAPGSANHIDDNEGLAVGPQSTDADDAVAAFTGRRDLVRNDLCQRPQHRVEDAVAGQRACRTRRRHHGVKNGSFRRPHLDAAEQADIVGNILRKDTPDAQIRQGVRETQRRIEGSTHLWRGACVVDEKGTVVIDRNGHLDRNGRVRESIVVNVIEEMISPARPGLYLLARQSLGIVEQFLHIGVDLVGAVTLQQLFKPAFADLRGGKLCREVSPYPVRDPDVDPDQRLQCRIEHAAVVELERRNTQPFLIDLRGVGCIRSRHAAAYIGVMTDHHGKGTPPAAVKNRHEHEDVRQMHAAMVGVVHDNDVAIVQIALELLQHCGHRLRDRTKMLSDGLGLRDHLTVARA